MPDAATRQTGHQELALERGDQQEGAFPLGILHRQGMVDHVFASLAQVFSGPEQRSVRPAEADC